MVAKENAEVKADSLEVVPFKKVGPYDFKLTRAKCNEMFGEPESEKLHATGHYRQVRGPCEIEFDEKSGKVTSVWIHSGNPTWGAHSLFTRQGVEAMREADGVATEAGAWQHFPKFGIVIGSMGKRKTSEGPVVLVCTAKRFGILKLMR